MKRTERHHLKENELHNLARQAREGFETRRREATGIIAVAVVVGVAILGYFVWHEHVQSRAHALLAEALVVQTARVGPPAAPGTAGAGSLTYPTERERAQAALTKFKAAADAYPSTDAGIYARYQEAATWVVLESPAQATGVYQQVIDHAGDGIYGQMARLGRAEAEALDGKYDQAINAFKELAQRKDGPLPIDGILMQLGKTYLDAGKRADAQQTFTRLVEEYPESPFTGDARKEHDNLKKT
jgi:tetratricopeptide (TPR) repeat protein